MSDITILIKTFKRPNAVSRLLDSISKYYPDIPIVIVDDGDSNGGYKTEKIKNVTWVKTNFDIGLAAGRNCGMLLIETPYTFTCDDDCIFTENTNLVKAKDMLVQNNLDILAIDAGLSYRGRFETIDNNTDHKTVKYLTGSYSSNNGVEKYDIVANIFIAKTDSLKKYKWDDDLKMGEHFAYFYQHLGKISVGYTSQISIRHEHISAPGYDEYRGRAYDFLKIYMKKAGIKKRIDFNGLVFEI